MASFVSLDQSRTTVFIFINICCKSHNHCELDENCPFHILLQCFEKKKGECDDYDENFGSKTQDYENLVDLADRHFSEFLHFADFGELRVQKWDLFG